MNAKQFRYVLVLAREGSFSKAADVLNITQPSLSQYIKKIEKEIGLELFDRTNGDVRITDAGRVYIDAGKRILDIEHQMENAINDLAACKTGSLVIGTSPYRAASMMPLIAQRFKAIHPHMYLIVKERTTSELIEGMEHGEYDLALTLRTADTERFCYEKLSEEELVLAVPEALDSMKAVPHENRKYPAVRAEALEGKPMVMLTETQFMQKQLEKLLHDRGLSVSAAAVVKSLEAQIEMVKAGVGIALVPSGIERFCSNSSVKFYSLTEDLPRREAVIMWRKSTALSKVAEELKTVIHSIQW